MDMQVSHSANSTGGGRAVASRGNTSRQIDRTVPVRRVGQPGGGAGAAEDSPQAQREVGQSAHSTNGDGSKCFNFFD
ncbi:unnamed protein product [Parnassius mnemosyne]|uniref:Uncharacterized protein n=1 Tax=Parnassius mnemosyne TaxID=213953 RepID=A0AAV1M1K2_9NEOP